MPPRLRFALLSLLAFASARCTGASNGDASADHAGDATGDARSMCVTDVDCDDHTFCNGAERCMPGSLSANARGCVPAMAAPCPPPTMCDEANTRCVNDCVDADHDGHSAMSCGGDDCDDSDPNRFPGNPEVCAWDSTRNMRVEPTHDEDCDANTLANRATSDGDRDHDTFIDVACCNASATGMHCGDDCVDTEAAVHAGATEACNGIDDDCDGMVDDGVPTMSFYPDCDGDGFGDSSAAGTVACGPLPTLSCMGHGALTDHSDCDDTNASVNTTATEVCNAIDDDCDGQTDEGLTTMTLHPDCDGDGYGDSAAAATITGCGAAGVAQCSGHPAVGDASDCRDDLDTVHPGVTAYANTPACPSGMSSCTWSELRINSSGTGTITTSHTNMCVPSGTCPTMQCGITGTACPPSIGPASTWDYDCSGTGERERLSTPSCPLAFFGGGPICPPYTYPMTTTTVPGSGLTDAATHMAPTTAETDCGVLQVQTWTCAYVAPSAMNPSPHCDIGYSAARGIGCR